MTDSSHPDRRTPASAHQATMFDQMETLTPSPAGRTPSPASINMKGTRSLARLRDRVDLTVRELERLRNENKKLRRDLERAANQPSTEVEGTQVIFSESGPELRAKVEACIATIDAHIGQKHIGQTEEVQ